MIRLNPLKVMENYLGSEAMMQVDALVSLIACFLYYHSKPDLKYNLVIAATAEEEISGNNGMNHCYHILIKLIVPLLASRLKCKWPLLKEG